MFLSDTSCKQSVYNTYLHVAAVPHFMQTVSIQHLPPHCHCPTLHADSQCTTPTSMLPLSHASCKQLVYNTYLHVSGFQHFTHTVSIQHLLPYCHCPTLRLNCPCTTPTSILPLSHTSFKQFVYNTYLHIFGVQRFTQTAHKTYLHSVHHLPPQCTPPTSPLPQYHTTSHKQRTYNTYLHVSAVPCFTETVQDRFLEIGSAGGLPRTRHNEDGKHLNQHALVNAGTILACTAKSNKPLS